MENDVQTEEITEEKVKRHLTLKEVWLELKDIILPVIIVFVLLKIIFNIFWVPSASMENTIPTKSLLFGWRLTYLVGNPSPQRGDIVTFQSDELDMVLVKRCIGVGGDTITIQNGYVYVNGEKLDESYVIEQGATGSDATFVVPEGCFFVLGDNRINSYDARYWTQPYISNDQIISHVLLCISIGNNRAWQGIHWLAS